jgi:AraC-like DNA-binding protein/ligand-binding sensor protein
MNKPSAALSGTMKQEFEKDLELFQYILVLLNDASPIRNVELMWAEDLDLFEPHHPIAASTGEALVQIHLHPVGHAGLVRTTPSTPFCDLVHGFGAYVSQTCAHSDEPAKQRCRTTGSSQVYLCHVGLTDIAVPVLCDGRYLGTLFSGQVLTEQPSTEHFATVKAVLQGHPHIDLTKLEKAYFRVPVVSKAQLAEMVRMLEVFARYIANSWKRLEIMGEFQRVRERELALDRRELAELLLSGQTGDREDALSLARKVGLEQMPNRVLLLRMHTQLDATVAPPAISNHLALDRVSHIVEDLCRRWPNTLCSTVRPGELCIFTWHEYRNSAHERMSLDEMAQAVLRAVRAQGITLARIGISVAHSQSHELLRAYHEACSALDSSQAAVSFFSAPAARRQEPTESLRSLFKALQLGEAAAVAAAVRDFLTHTAPAAGSTEQMQQTRGLLTWACEHLGLELTNLGAPAAQVRATREQAISTVISAPSPFAVAEAFRQFVEQMRQLVVQTFRQREEKIVMEVHRLILEMDPARVTIQDLADALHLSAGHLSRVYSRKTEGTLEEYLIRQRVEMGKRLLLDPRLHVAEVADRCGFCNPAYFSSVFKKYMHCTPREYASTPQRWSQGMSGEPAPL